MATLINPFRGVIEESFDPKPQAKVFLNTINTFACGFGSNVNRIRIPETNRISEKPCIEQRLAMKKDWDVHRIQSRNL